MYKNFPPGPSMAECSGMQWGTATAGAYTLVPVGPTQPRKGPHGGGGRAKPGSVEHRQTPGQPGTPWRRPEVGWQSQRPERDTPYARQCLEDATVYHTNAGNAQCRAQNPLGKARHGHGSARANPPRGQHGAKQAQRANYTASVDPQHWGPRAPPTATPPGRGVDLDWATMEILTIKQSSRGYMALVHLARILGWHGPIGPIEPDATLCATIEEFNYLMREWRFALSMFMGLEMVDGVPMLDGALLTTERMRYMLASVCHHTMYIVPDSPECLYEPALPPSAGAHPPPGPQGNPVAYDSPYGGMHQHPAEYDGAYQQDQHYDGMPDYRGHGMHQGHPMPTELPGSESAGQGPDTPPDRNSQDRNYPGTTKIYVVELGYPAHQEQGTSIGGAPQPEPLSPCGMQAREWAEAPSEGGPTDFPQHPGGTPCFEPSSPNFPQRQQQQQQQQQGSGDQGLPSAELQKERERVGRTVSGTQFALPPGMTVEDFATAVAKGNVSNARMTQSVVTVARKQRAAHERWASYMAHPQQSAWTQPPPAEPEHPERVGAPAQMTAAPYPRTEAHPRMEATPRMEAHPRMEARPRMETYTYTETYPCTETAVLQRTTPPPLGEMYAPMRDIAGNPIKCGPSHFPAIPERYAPRPATPLGEHVLYREPHFGADPAWIARGPDRGVSAHPSRPDQKFDGSPVARSRKSNSAWVRRGAPRGGPARVRPAQPKVQRAQPEQTTQPKWDAAPKSEARRRSRTPPPQQHAFSPPAAAERRPATPPHFDSQGSFAFAEGWEDATSCLPADEHRA